MKSKISRGAARSRRFNVLQKLSFAVLASGALLATRSAQAQQAYTDAGATGVFSTAITPTITADTSAANGDSLTFNNTATSSQTDDLTFALNFNVLTFSNTAALTLLQGTGTTLTLASTTGGTAPTVNLNNTGTVANGLNIVLANNTTFAGTGSATFSGVVSGGGSLTKTGAGTLTLSGTNTYSGGTNVNGGILAVTSDANLGSTAAANLVTLNGGALQGGTASASVTISANHGVVIGASGGTLTTNGGDNGNGIVFNTANTLSGSGNLTITGNNASSNNTILVGAAQNLTGSIFLEDRIQLTNAAATLGTGAITIAGGTAIGTGTAFGSATTGQIFITQSSGTVTLANALFLNGNGADNRGAFRIAGPALTLNGNITLQSNAYLSGTGTNTTTLNGTTTGAFTLNLGGSTGSSNSANYVLNGADSASATSINNGSLTLGTSTAAQGTQLTGGTNGTVKFTPGIGTFFAGSLGGSAAIGLADTGGTAVTLSVGATQTYSGTLTGGTGSALTYTGTGEAHFQGTATGFTGAINVNTTGNGKLDVNSSLGSGGSYNVTSGATLFVFGGTLANTIFNLSGTGNGENLGALRLDGGNIDATSTVNLVTNTTIGGNGGTATIAGVIAGTGFGFTKQGGDTLVLSGANTFSGTTTHNGSGTLNLSNALALQNSTLNYTGGALVFDSSVTGNAFTFGALGGSSNIALLNNAGTPAAISLTAGGNNASTTYSGVLSGTGSTFTKTGIGTLTLNSAATLTGNFTIGNGTVALNGDNQVSAGPLVFGTVGAANNTLLTFSQNAKTFANAITSQGSGGSNTIQSTGGGQTFTFSGAVTLASGASASNLILNTGGPTGNNSDALIFSNSFSGTGNLTTTAGSSGTTGGGSITLSGSSINNVGTITNNGSSSSAVTINGVIGSNVTGVTQNSATSQLNIANNNSYTGGTNILNGTVFSSVGGNTSNTFGSGTIAFGTAGAANTTLLSLSNGGKSFSNALSSTGSGGTNTIFTSGGGQTFTFSGAATLSSGASPSTFVLSTGGANGNNSNILSLTGGITGTGNVVTQSGDAGTTGAGAVTISGANVNFTGTLTNRGSATSSSGTQISAVIGTNVTGVVQNSAGSPLTLSATNTYTGPTTVTAGLLSLTSTGSINGSTSVQVGSTGALTLANSTALADAGTLSLVTGSTLTLGAANGTTENIGSLILNGNVEPTGTYDMTSFFTLAGSSGINFTSSFGETLTVGAVPEPSTWVGGMFCVGAIGVFFRRRVTGVAKDCRVA